MLKQNEKFSKNVLIFLTPFLSKSSKHIQITENVTGKISLRHISIASIQLVNPVQIGITIWST